MAEASTQPKASLFNKFLNGIEAVGNKLPHPVSLFAIFALIIIIISAICDALGVSATGDLINRSKGIVETQTINTISLLNKQGLVYMLTSTVKNFTGFAPLGTVLVAMLGVGIAESSGYIPALLKHTVKITPKQIITPVVVFLGVMSNVASDAGYVVLIPIGALMFMAYGRHPMAGLAAAFAGVSGGFSANLIIGTTDTLLSGISDAAVKLIDPSYIVHPTSNWYFMFVSTFLITIVGTIVTDKIVEPRLGKFTPNSINAEDAALANGDFSKRETKALKAANWTIILMVLGIIALCIPESSFLRNPNTGSLIAGSPLMDGIIILIALYFFIPAVVYGKVSGNFKGEKDVCKALGASMSSMGGYIALAFVAAQFIAYFGYTNLGTILAINGANFLKSIGLSGVPLMLLFILFSAFINLFMGSASAKWTIMAPVFVPMFMLLGYSPELTQVAYRIGDSSTNIITPLMSYFAMIVVFAKKYDEKAGIGTLIATMLPYSMTFLIFWSILLIVWMMLGLPVGPGAPLMLG